MKHLYHKPGSFKEAQEREHDKVMGPRRGGDDSEDLGGFPVPGGRMGAQEQEQKGGCPWLQRAPGKRHFLRLCGGKGQGQHCSLGGVGRTGRMTYLFLACSAEQKVYPREQVAGSLWSMVDP